jgi:hypothetical protein
MARSCVFTASAKNQGARSSTATSPMTPFTAVIQLALALLANAQSTSAIVTDVRQQAITTASSVDEIQAMHNDGK